MDAVGPARRPDDPDDDAGGRRPPFAEMRDGLARVGPALGLDPAGLELGAGRSRARPTADPRGPGAGRGRGTATPADEGAGAAVPGLRVLRADQTGGDRALRAPVAGPAGLPLCGPGVG